MQNLNKIAHDIKNQCNNINAAMDKLDTNLNELKDINNTFKSIPQFTETENKKIISSDRNKKKSLRWSLLFLVGVLLIAAIFKIISINEKYKQINTVLNIITILYVILFSDIINFIKYCKFLSGDNIEESELKDSWAEQILNGNNKIVKIIFIFCSLALLFSLIFLMFIYSIIIIGKTFPHLVTKCISILNILINLMDRLPSEIEAIIGILSDIFTYYTFMSIIVKNRIIALSKI